MLPPVGNSFIDADIEEICTPFSNSTDRLLLGDIKINLYDKGVLVHDYLDSLSTKGSEQNHYEITRAESGTLIDHAFHNFSPMSEPSVMISPRPDHAAIVICIKDRKIQRYQPSTKTIYDYK